MIQHHVNNYKWPAIGFIDKLSKKGHQIEIYGFMREENPSNYYDTITIAKNAGYTARFKQKKDYPNLIKNKNFDRVAGKPDNA